MFPRFPYRILILLLFVLLLSTSARAQIIYSGQSSSRVVAFIFDDGPRQPAMSSILDVLKKYDVKAVFFLVGRRIGEDPAVVRRAQEEGHSIGNHTHYHNRLTVLSRKNVVKELELCSSSIERTIGLRPRFFRPPGGHYNQVVVEEAARLGMDVVMCTINPPDFAGLPPNLIVEEVMKKLHGGAIILLHVAWSNTVEALPKLIEAVRKRNYEILLLEEMLARGRSSGILQEVE